MTRFPRPEIWVFQLHQLPIYPLRSAKFQLLFDSAEKVLEERLLNVLKDNSSSIQQNLAAVVIDESHRGDMDRKKVFPHYEVQFS